MSAVVAILVFDSSDTADANARHCYVHWHAVLIDPRLERRDFSLAVYGAPKALILGQELDPIFAKIARQAAG